ncbi:hypothetical protein [Bacillus sp. FJAT-27445]|uniref:hypothetical protein n=1 Tax=Bacillus sp. FJAT-27445 TaxID=1679166 RepID=UPI00074329E9|nr:hypothetical protein [Bacillus sp. FJAT-27445]
MEPHFRSEARRIFRRELFNMKEEGYLKPEIVDEVADAHFKYHQDLLEEDRRREEARASIIHKQTPAVGQQAAPQVSLPVPRQQVQRKEKKILTSEQIRERNISWLLNIGVIFLLVGGLFVATSNWESMTQVMKSTAIALVSLLFYGFAYLSARILKIEKTAFAFTVLGSLFLPIFVLSLGWFGLLGPYLSVTGEGRFLLGFLGSFVPGAVYAVFAKKLTSRLFVWFSFIAFSIAAGFLLASFRLPVDYFYLGIMAYNAAIIFLFFKLRNRGTLALYAKEFPVFIQANLVVSTLLMLFFFDNELIYSFNLLLTAAIYLSMMYVSGRKEYHFIFSAMIVYGAYQLIEHTYLKGADAIFYASIAFAFVFIPKTLKGNLLLERAFRYTSAAVSLLAFFYISVEGMLLRAGEPSFVLALAYVIIAGNFLYLAHAEKQLAFPYLSAAFLGAAFFEASSLFGKYIYDMNLQTSIFIAAMILFILIGWVKAKRVFAPLRLPARDLGIVGMILAILLSYGLGDWIELGTMLILLSGFSIIVRMNEERAAIKWVSIWAVPVFAGLAVLVFGHEAILELPIYRFNFGYPISFAAGAVLLLAASFAWRKRGDGELAASFFYSAQLSYTFGLILSVFLEMDSVAVRPILVLGGLGIYYLLYRSHRILPVAALLSIVTYGFYLSVVVSVYKQVHFGEGVSSFIGTGGAVFVLLLAYVFRKKDVLLYTGYAWTGHIILPVTLLLVWFAFPGWAIYSLAASVVVYGISTYLAALEWKNTLFLYAAFTAAFLTISKGFDMAVTDYSGNYEFPVTSLIILGVWLLVKSNLKKWTEYYLAAFSIFGIAAMAFTYPFTLIPYSITMVYGAGILLFLHRLKWDLLGLLPILLMFFASMGYLSNAGLANIRVIGVTAALGMAHAAIGLYVYPHLYKVNSRIYDSQIDWYALGAFLYFASLYSYPDPSIWMSALPGVLISITIWLQGRRVDKKIGFFIPILAGIYLLEPYYSVIARLDIPALFDREAFVLPLIAIMVFIRKAIKGRYHEIISKLQWAVLIITAILLIQDGLESNTVYDALILGTLSLLSMLAGMFYRMKSYFFTGAAVLLLNLLLQTRPLWGNLPWWGYLLGAGSLLIGIASYNEWKKQNDGKGRESLAARLKIKIVTLLKGWD